MSSTVSFPQKTMQSGLAGALSLTPDFNTLVGTASPVLKWGDVLAASEYKVTLKHETSGTVIKLGWLTSDDLGCDSIWCKLDLAALDTPIVLENGTASIQAGAGIVADSNPTAEYEETRDKARAMVRALELAAAGL